jgi:hypothetical protein
MSTRNLTFPVTKGDGTVEHQFVECQLRPIQLWGFVFPKEHLDAVCNSLKFPSENPTEFKDGKFTYNFDRKLWALRKLLKAKPFPIPDKAKGLMFLPYERIKSVNILGIGYREDGDMAEFTHERI